MADPASYPDAISGIESGGRYDLLGPVTKSGDQAYGKYQVMGANVPAWTKQVLGKEMTPQEFLASPEAQDAVFNGIFGGYVNKYGPEGAAKAWFAGEKGMNNPDAKDMLGTSVASYGRQFMAALGKGAPATAQAAAPQAAPAASAPSTAAAAPSRGVLGSLAALAPSQASAPSGGVMQFAEQQAAPAPALGLLPPQPHRPIDLTKLRAMLSRARA